MSGCPMFKSAVVRLATFILSIAFADYIYSSSSVKPHKMAEAALVDGVNKALGSRSLLKTEVTLKSNEGAGGDCLVASQELTASVIYPTDSSTHSSSQVGHERLACQRKSRREKEVIRKRIYHQKVKDERNTLRKTVEDLTLKLEELKQGKQSTSLGFLDSVWKDLAAEEREKLLKSEAEQRQLLAAAEAKACCIMELCKQVPASVAQSISSPTTVDSDVASPVLPTIPPFDYTMYRGHLRRVHESYALTDSVLDCEAMAEGVITSSKRRDIDNEVEYFERRQKFSEPFSYAHTQRTMWKLWKLYHRQQNREDFGQVAGSDDISVVRYRVLQTLATGSTVSVLKRYVARRFVEENRTVIVCKTHTEGEGVFRGMHSDETGWIRIQPTADEDVTEVLACIRQVPVSFGISTSTEVQVDEFHQILQSSIHEDMIEVTSALEKLLLEDTLAGRDI
ncbi:hypothetical protein PC116_g22490 [Phytophthora cactorum]|uniref:Uncharacterized protein n=2 Tax=Phytophthora cactorum TaxID=29920 RepID=A0A329RF32_9STRA|nr:hypothetical protein PC117_g19719 [Phytophthora cactorum]KAG2968152.1 hypothetical protein PC118_g18193 [Phytophthora cactorum]KAG4229170.1 hypothetical protein PC116_g22490 [Phytophthora cactorum]RAW22639.1 hypothetical protein PC110_g20918 [Phytophthora cactorum]